MSQTSRYSVTPSRKGRTRIAGASLLRAYAGLQVACGTMGMPTATVRLVGQAVRKVLENYAELDVRDVAAKADKSLYERGWAQQR